MANSTNCECPARHDHTKEPANSRSVSLGSGYGYASCSGSEVLANSGNTRTHDIRSTTCRYIPVSGDCISRGCGALGRRHAGGSRDHELLYLRNTGTLFYNVHVVDSVEIHENDLSSESQPGGVLTSEMLATTGSDGNFASLNASQEGPASSHGAKYSPGTERSLRTVVESSADDDGVFATTTDGSRKTSTGCSFIHTRSASPTDGGGKSSIGCSFIPARGGSPAASVAIPSISRKTGEGSEKRHSPPFLADSPSNTVSDIMKKLRRHKPSHSPPGSGNAASPKSSERRAIPVVASHGVGRSSPIKLTSRFSDTHIQNLSTSPSARSSPKKFIPGHRRAPSDPLGKTQITVLTNNSILGDSAMDDTGALGSDSPLPDAPLQRSFSFRGLRRGLSPSSSNSEVSEVKDHKQQMASEALHLFSSSKSSKPSLPLMQFTVRHLAEEMTLLDGEMIRRIRVEELAGCCWIKKKKNELAPNIVQMVSDFNRVALAVSTDILSQKTPQGRASVIVFLIKVAVECLQLHNYNSLQAILGGLQCAAIHRLTATWKEVPSKWQKQLQKLASLMAGENNFANYRRALENSLELKKCVPFLGIFLSQVALMDAYQDEKKESAVSGDVPNRQVAVGDACQLMPSLDSACQLGGSITSRPPAATILSELWRYQLASFYSCQSRINIRHFLLTWQYASEKESYKLSEELEPPVKRTST